MARKADTVKKSIIDEIRDKIRLLNAIAAFIVVALLAVILRYLYKPFSQVMDFLPDVSVTLIIGIILFLTVIGFYMWAVVTRRIIGTIEKYRNRLDRILAITKDLREEIYGDILLNKIMEHSLSITQSDAGSVFLVEGDDLVSKAAKGEEASGLIDSAIPKGRGIAGWVAEKGFPVRIADAKTDERFDPAIDRISESRSNSVLCVPLTMKTGVLGVIELVKKKGGFYSIRDEEIISYIADHAAISLARAKFYEDQRNYEIHVADMLLEAMDFHVPEKMGHPKRVAKYANVIAKAINMSDEDRKRLYFACLLHDVGFLKIRAEDNFKHEYFVKHPVIGFDMISPINFYADIAPFILHHHERYDGSGYPHRLKGEEIPLEARIIAITEAFDVMVGETSYKIPINFDDAVEELKRNAGTQFDFWLVDEFVSNATPELLQ